MTVVVNHLGGQLDPALAADPAGFGAWRAAVAAVARCPNAVMKCGGLTPPSAMPFHMSRRATPVHPPLPMRPHARDHAIK